MVERARIWEGDALLFDVVRSVVNGSCRAVPMKSLRIDDIQSELDEFKGRLLLAVLDNDTKIENIHKLENKLKLAEYRNDELSAL